MNHKYLVITKDKKQEADSFFNSLGISGETFTVELYKNNEHTHYFAGILLTDTQYSEIAKKYTTSFDSYFDMLNILGLNVKNEE